MSISTHDSALAFVAIQAALNAGQIIRKAFGTQFTITSKTNPLDLVTEWDKATEEAIIATIRQQFPTHAFLGEESGSTEVPDAPVLWIIDPIDGTMNFAHHIPMFCVSIAAYIKPHIEVGVIYQPMTNELFVAQRNRGAYLNGTRLKVSKISEMKYGVVATGFPYESAKNREQSIQQFLCVLDVGNPIRILGSAALSLAYVAAGLFEAYWGQNLSPWDIAAGKLLIEEAGGTLSDFKGTSLELFEHRHIIATNTLLHHAIVSCLK